MRLGADFSGNLPFAQIRNDAFQGQTTLVLGAWGHICAVMDGSNKILYWNGAEDRQAPLQGPAQGCQRQLFFVVSDN